MRRKNQHHDGPVKEPASGTDRDGTVGASDVAAVQNDAGITAVDRVDMIANQILHGPDGNARA